VGILGIAVDRRAVARRRSRPLVVAAAASAVLAVSGCAASFSAPTNEPYQPAAGISDRSGSVFAINALVVADDSGNGTVVASLINQEPSDDSLQSFSASDSAGKQITTPTLDTPISLPAYPSPSQIVQVGPTGDLRLSGDNVDPGTFVNVTFTFGTAAPLTVNVPVVLGGSDTMYADIPVGPVSTAAASG
jgi:hypothetical protein